tara:strand:+ start:2806 stop:4632 length:1827 start_codon:yes stop_codon:yes gene_type:complete
MEKIFSKIFSELENKLDFVTFISYNTIISGSVELRSLNLHYVFETLKSIPDKKLSKIGKYAFMYDNPVGGGGKNNEPNYDGLTSLMSVLPDEIFDSNFCLKKVRLSSTEGEWGVGNFTNDHKAAKKLVMIPESKSVETSRNSLFGNNYSKYNYIHIYVLSPLSNESLIEIANIISNLDNKNRVIIHYQGESHLSDDMGNVLSQRIDKNANPEYLEFFGMTPKGGVFVNSFNYVGGMKHGIVFRDFISKCPNVYTVCVKSKNVRFINGDLQNKINPFDNRMSCERKLPSIYQYLNDWIIRNIYTENSNPDIRAPPSLRPRRAGFLKLKNVLVIEDLYDKDNSTAIEILSLFTIQNKLRLCLVGRECSATLIDGQEATVINRRVAELCSGRNTNTDSPSAGQPLPEEKTCVPPYIKPNDFPTGMFFTLLKFFPPPNSNSRYWPEFKDNRLTQKYDCERTANENKLMASAILHLLSSRAIANIDLVGNSVYNRDHESIAYAGQNAGDVAPFNELLFVPGLYFALDVITNEKKSELPLSYIKTGFKEILDMIPDIYETRANPVLGSSGGALKRTKERVYGKKNKTKKLKKKSKKPKKLKKKSKTKKRSLLRK